MGRVTEAVNKAPIVPIQDRTPRFVLMSLEHYHRLRAAGGPRRAYGIGETPDDISAQFIAELDRLAHGEGYGDED